MKKGGDTTAEDTSKGAQRGDTTWGPLHNNDEIVIGIGRAQKMWVSNSMASNMDVHAHVSGTGGIEDARTISPRNTAEFIAPSGEYWTQVDIKGLGTEDQSASGDVKWS